jgi:methyl-accepting chemotaxis protein
MTIAARLYLFAVAGILGLLLVGGAGVYYLSSFSGYISSNLEEVSKGNHVLADLKTSHIAFKTQVQEWKNILIRGNRQDDFDKYLKQFGQEEAKVQNLLGNTAEGLRAMGDATVAGEAETLKKEHLALGTKYREALKGFDVADREAGRKVDHAVKGMDRPTAQGMEALVTKIEKQELEHLKSQISESEARYATDRNILFAIILLVAVAAGITVLIIVRGIRNSLTTMQQTVESIPRTWDLRTRIAVTGQDEVSQTGRTINVMLDSFQNVVGRIIENARQTSATCSQMAGSLREIEQAVAQQNDATSTMAAAVEELTTSFSQIHSNANESLAATSEARQSALTGDRIISQTSGAMTGIVGSVQGAASVIERVGAQSDNISTIVQVIREVADQTNLLALNAAIEAARAGEQGRGFAVVADEVRKLAEKTTSSAEEIKRMIEAVQQSANQAVGDIRQVVDQVQEINEKSREAQTAMGVIRSHTEKSEGFSRDITYSLSEQSAASTLIAKNVETVARMSEENAANVTRAEQAMQELEKETRTLQEAVARFTV